MRKCQTEVQHGSRFRRGYGRVLDSDYTTQQVVRAGAPALHTATMR